MGKREAHRESRSKIINRLSTKADVIEIKQSRCLRRRFYKSRCSKCRDCCPADAIKIEGGLDIDRAVCAECMVCVAECPSGAIDIPSLNFYSIISKLRKIPHLPVLACNIKEELDAHVTTFCLGFLSEEHLIALMVFIREPLQINLTGCKTCKNSFIVDALKKRLDSVISNFEFRISNFNPSPLPPAPYTLNIRLIENKTDLQYQDVPFDRRGFFGALKGLAKEGAANLFVSVAESKDTTTAYSEKVLPFKRRLLNKALSIMIESNTKDNKTSVSQRGTTSNGNVILTQAGIQRKMGLDSPIESGNDMVGGLSNKILANYYFDLLVDENCDMCFACRGMCPTGALRETYMNDAHGENPEQKLLFNASLCNGCGLCSDFCAQSSISIKQGFSGNPFEEKCAKSL